MKKKKLNELFLNKKTISELSNSVQNKIKGGSDSCYTGTYPPDQCCGGGGGGGNSADCFPNTGTVQCYPTSQDGCGSLGC